MFTSFMHLLRFHYSSTSPIYTPPSLDTPLLFHIPFTRLLLIPAAILIQFCTGTFYAWSVYNTPIEYAIYGHATSTAAITFYIAVGGFGASTALFGPWLERHGPRKGCILGAAGFFVGNILAALGIWLKMMWVVWIGFGIVGGGGVGLAYISPVSVLQKWFPEKRGMASGLAVCGFGAGSIAAAPLQLALINKIGVAWTFLVLGSSYFVVMVVCSLVLRVPPTGFTVDMLDAPFPNEKNIVAKRTYSSDVDSIESMTKKGSIPSTLGEMLYMDLPTALFSTNFRLVYVLFLANAVTGLVFLSRLSSIVTSLFSQSASFGAMTVAVNGGFNLGGRILFGVLSDCIGRKTCFLITLSVQFAILVIGFPLAMGDGISTSEHLWAFLILIWILSTCYGASFALLPPLLTDLFGANNIGACHGITITAWSIAGIGGGFIYTAVYNTLVPAVYPPTHPWPHRVNFIWLACIVAIGMVCAVGVKSRLMDRLYPAQEGEWARLRVCKWMVRVRRGLKVEVVGPRQQHEEWHNWLQEKGLKE